MAAAAAATTTTTPTAPERPPPPFDTEEGIKFIPSVIHPVLHRQPAISNFVQTFLTNVDATLYSSEFRGKLHSLFSGNNSVSVFLADPEATRQHLYRFYVKGSNDYILIERYLHAKHGVSFKSSPPSAFESDWDMSVLISPHLPNHIFEIIHKEIRNTCLEKLIAFSHILPTINEYKINIVGGIEDAKRLIDAADMYAPYRGWKIQFKDTAGKKMSVYDGVRGRGIDQEMVERLGLSGNGTIVRSNYTPFEGSQFYLARLMANVVAGRGILLPVEIIDIAIPYKGTELEFAWEGHTEFHFVLNGFDYRILSPIGLYVDLAKTIRDAEVSGNNRRTRKLGRRLQRVERLLNEVIRPYGAENTVIQNNIQRLMASGTAVGSAVRALTRRLENRRAIRGAANLFEEMDEEE